MRSCYEGIFCRALPKTHVVAAIESTLYILRKIAYAFGDRSRVWYHYGGKVAPPDLRWDLVQPAAVHRHLLRAGIRAWPPPPAASRRARRRARALPPPTEEPTLPGAPVVDDVLADPEIAAFLDVYAESR
jgi:hypothetical protein